MGLRGRVKGVSNGAFPDVKGKSQRNMKWRRRKWEDGERGREGTKRRKE